MHHNTFDYILPIKLTVESLTIPYLFSVANILFFLAVLPNIGAVWQNRAKLRGFSKYGILLNFGALTLMEITYVLMNMWLPFVVGLMTWGYMGILLYFIVRLVHST